jgi:hypothetical protein
MAKASDYKIVTFQRQPGQRPLGVKRRNTRGEQMFSALPLRTDMERLCR